MVYTIALSICLHLGQGRETQLIHRFFGSDSHELWTSHSTGCHVPVGWIGKDMQEAWDCGGGDGKRTNL